MQRGQNMKLFLVTEVRTEIRQYAVRAMTGQGAEEKITDVSHRLRPELEDVLVLSDTANNTVTTQKMT